MEDDIYELMKFYSLGTSLCDMALYDCTIWMADMVCDLSGFCDRDGNTVVVFGGNDLLCLLSAHGCQRRFDVRIAINLTRKLAI